MILQYYQFFEYGAFILSLIYYKGLKTYSLQLLVPLLFIICLVETLAVNSYEWMGIKSNIFIYNYYLLLHPFFYLPLFYKVLKPKGYLKGVYITIAVMVLFFVVAQFAAGPEVYQNNTNILTLVLYLALSLILLSKLVTNDNPQVLTRNPYFWIAVGIILFSLVAVIIQGLRSYFIQNDVLLLGKPIYRSLMYIANSVFYLCYMYAFYLCSKNQKAASNYIANP